MRKAEVLLLSSAIALLTGTMLLFAFGDPSMGILFALLSVTAFYVILSFVNVDSAVKGAVEVVCLLQVYTLMISSLPWFFIGQDYLIPAVYLILGSLCLWHIRDSNLNLDELGLRWAPPRSLIISIMLGALLGVVEYFILLPPPALPSFSVAYFLQTAFHMIVFVGLVEELLFRGILLTSLEKFIHHTRAQIMQALIFAILHLTWRSMMEVIFVFIAGLAFGLLFKRYKSLVPPALAHGVGNLFLIGVLPFIV